MPKYVFKGGYPVYYPNTGLFTKPGEVHELDAAPDANWSAVVDDARTAVAAVAPAVAPVAAAVAKDAPDVVKAAENAAPAVEVAAEDALKAAEALLEANPELAARLVEEAKNA
jgi:hypothetical protein